MTSAATAYVPNPSSSSRILAATQSTEDWLRPGSRARMPSLPTELLSVSPEFLAQLRAELAPKPKGARLRFILGLMLLGVFAVLGADGSTREFAIDKSRMLTTQLLASRLPAAAPASSVATASTHASAAATVQVTAATNPSPAVTTAPAGDTVHTPTVVVPAKAPKMVTPTPPAKKRTLGRPVSALGRTNGAILVSSKPRGRANAS